MNTKRNRQESKLVPTLLTNASQEVLLTLLGYQAPQTGLFSSDVLEVGHATLHFSSPLQIPHPHTTVTYIGFYYFKQTVIFLLIYFS